MWRREWKRSEAGRASEAARRKALQQEKASAALISARTSIQHQLQRLAKGGTGQHVPSKITGAPGALLRYHFLVQFRGEMSWPTYGQTWVLDHVRPCASFDLTDPAQAALCHNWRNLQPLTPDENHAKAERWTREDEEAWVARMRRLEYDGELFLRYC
jgi:hypothetical protein